MIIHDYDYRELEKKALSLVATQTDIDNLGEWFERYGDEYWNGQCYIIDRYHDLYPVYEGDEANGFDIIGYEIR